MEQTLAAVSLEEQLEAYRHQLDPGIQKLCVQLEHEAGEQFGQYSQQATHAFAEILVRGGKRVRGALVLASYQMCGGDDVERVMPVAHALEMLQAYLLIADDIYDRSATRRGGPTAHMLMRDLHEQNGWHGDSQHFGESIAGCAALIGCHLAMEHITVANLSDHAKVMTLRLINKALSTTGYGQINDMFGEATRTQTEAEVQQMLTWKTAYYSFVAPLQIGAVAAGANEAALACLQEYGTHMGLAFQVADDILGTFGDESKSGKSTQDDLREGKMTLLVSCALQRANQADKAALLGALGKEDLTTAEYQACKAIITSTGALEYARNLATSHSRLAVAALQAAPAQWKPDRLDFLRALADYVVNRKG